MEIYKLMGGEYISLAAHYADKEESMRDLLAACRAIQAANPLRKGQTTRGGALGMVDAAIAKATGK